MTDLSTGIYSRLGEHFSLGYLPHFYPLYRATPAQIDVYAALESGITAHTLCDTLHAASTYPLPANVRQMLEEWAARRERLTVYRNASLVEFADQAARDAALAGPGLSGQPVGERFIVLSAQPRRQTTAVQSSRTVDYCTAPVRCVQVAEDGTVHIHRTHADLLVRGEVAAWADPGRDEDHWRLTRASIGRAVKAGWTAASIIDNLSQRAQQPVPALLIVAIRAWAGERALPRAVALASDILLQIADPWWPMPSPAARCCNPICAVSSDRRLFSCATIRPRNCSDNSWSWVCRLAVISGRAIGSPRTPRRGLRRPFSVGHGR